MTTFNVLPNKKTECPQCGQRVMTQENAVILPHYAKGLEVLCSEMPKVKKLKINGKKTKVLILDEPHHVIDPDCMFSLGGENWHETHAKGDTLSEHPNRQYIKRLDFFDKSLEEIV